MKGWKKMYEVNNDNKRECAWCNECNIVQESYNKGRADAIDEFMNKALAMLKAEQDTRYGYLDCMDIREIAQQLKEKK